LAARELNLTYDFASYDKVLNPNPSAKAGTLSILASSSPLFEQLGRASALSEAAFIVMDSFTDCPIFDIMQIKVHTYRQRLKALT
jgi:hypothetical protein